MGARGFFEKNTRGVSFFKLSAIDFMIAATVFFYVIVLVVDLFDALSDDVQWRYWTGCYGTELAAGREFAAERISSIASLVIWELVFLFSKRKYVRLSLVIQRFVISPAFFHYSYIPVGC